MFLSKMEKTVLDIFNPCSIYESYWEDQIYPLDDGQLYHISYAFKVTMKEWKYAIQTS